MNSKSEQLLLLILGAIQFCTTLDFVIILPLEPQYMRLMHINPAQFSLVVSSYAIAAGVAGLAAGFFLDLLDRKSALLGLFSGFGVGTLLCALAPTYPMLVAARAVAGAFGGVTGALVLSIVGDVIPEERRGAAMGLVMSSFSVASIVGLPLGLWLAAKFSWHVPFFIIAGVCVPILLAVCLRVPSLRGHLRHVGERHPAARLWAVLMEPNHQLAFVFTAALTFAGLTIFTNLATYMEFNVGLSDAQLPLIYLTGGICTVFSMNWIGRWADRAGKLRVFTLMSLSAAVPIIALTNLPRVPLPVALATSTLLMICMSGRFVPAMAMLTGAVESRFRGGFMSVNSAVQQFACGLAAWASGAIVGQGPKQEITRFPLVGIASLCCVFSCIWLARFLKPAARDLAGAPVVAEPV
ncbi:MAG TPA: MFS transporter, partial [Candidatus Acidoferrum sp.]|nr:MFS transporter [Candidatus Acidoferrum sp.]